MKLIRIPKVEACAYAGRVVRWANGPPENPYHIKAGDVLHIDWTKLRRHRKQVGEVEVFTVEEDGSVLLRPDLEKVQLAGLTLLEAEEAVKKVANVSNPEALVTIGGWKRVEDFTLEDRVQDLEEEVKQLREAIEELQRNKE